MAKTKKEIVKDVYPKVIETFRPVGDWELTNMKSSGPSTFNGIVQFRKYRVTVELIDEPVEVLQERLEKLWLECDNHHQWTPIQNAAKSIGYTFKGERGSQKVKK